MIDFIYEKSGYAFSLLIYFVYRHDLPRMLDVWYWDSCVETLIIEMFIFWMLIQIIKCEKIGVYVSNKLKVTDSSCLNTFLRTSFVVYTGIYIIFYAIFYYIDNNFYPLSANEYSFIITWCVIILFTVMLMRLHGYFDMIYDETVYKIWFFVILTIVALSIMIGLWNMDNPYNDFKEYYLSSDKNKIAIVKARIDDKVYIQPKIDPNQCNTKELNVVNTNVHNAVICLNFEEKGLKQGKYTIKYKVNNREYSEDIWYIINGKE